MFLISATFNICNYEDIMKRYDCKVALPGVELFRDDTQCGFECILCVPVYLAVLIAIYGYMVPLYSGLDLEDLAFNGDSVMIKYNNIFLISFFSLSLYIYILGVFAFV